MTRPDRTGTSHQAPLARVLSPGPVSGVPRKALNEPQFRWALNADAMATEKLVEGIRNFDKDHKALIAKIVERTG